MYFIKPPTILKKFYPDLIWEIPNNENTIFLTFDDGPSPGITEQVLEILNKYNAKATFFCLGNKVEKYPKIYENILKEGHCTANHSYSHFNGWNVNDDIYISDIEKCNRFVHSNLFRPPYGKITFSQIKKIMPTYKIIMWNLLSADFDEQVSSKQCLKNVVNNVKSGSVLVFHDSEKAKKNLLFTLPRFLEVCSKQKINCSIISEKL